MVVWKVGKLAGNLVDYLAVQMVLPMVDCSVVKMAVLMVGWKVGQKVASMADHWEFLSAGR